MGRTVRHNRSRVVREGLILKSGKMFKQFILMKDHFRRQHVNLLEPHSTLCTTSTDPSLYLLVIADICIATYPQYVNCTNSNVHLGFSHPGQIQLDCYLGDRVSSYDPISMLSQSIPEPMQYVIRIYSGCTLRSEV